MIEEMQNAGRMQLLTEPLTELKHCARFLEETFEPIKRNVRV
jgi:hypothetical protein